MSPTFYPRPDGASSIAGGHVEACLCWISLGFVGAGQIDSNCVKYGSTFHPTSIEQGMNFVFFFSEKKWNYLFLSYFKGMSSHGTGTTGDLLYLAILH